jgi:DNA-binding NtrC family response regulator
VLIIEDDSAVTTLVEMSLEARGAEVISVSNLSQLRAVLLGKPLVDAVLLDLSPLEGNLTPALHDLRVACPQAVLVLMSGQPGGVPEEAEANFAAWIRKPFDMDQLAQRLAELLQQRRPVAS